MGNPDRVNHKQIMESKIGTVELHSYNRYFPNWGGLAIVSLGKIQRTSSIYPNLGNLNYTLFSTKVPNIFSE